MRLVVTLGIVTEQLHAKAGEQPALLALVLDQWRVRAAEGGFVDHHLGQRPPPRLPAVVDARTA